MTRNSVLCPKPALCTKPGVKTKAVPARLPTPAPMHQPTGSGAHQPFDRSFSSFSNPTSASNNPTWLPTENWDISTAQMNILQAALNGEPVADVEEDDERAFFRPPMHQRPMDSMARQPAPFPAQYGTLPLEQVQVPARSVAIPQPWTAAPAGNRDPNLQPIVQTRPVPAMSTPTVRQVAAATPAPSRPPSAPSMELDGFEVVSSGPGPAVQALQPQSRRKRKSSSSALDDAQVKKPATRKPRADKKKTPDANIPKPKKGGVPGRKRFTPEEDNCMLSYMEKYLPGGGHGMKDLPSYMQEHGLPVREVSSYRRRYDLLVGVLKPTGNPNMAPVIERAKRLELQIGGRTGVFDIADPIPDDGTSGDEDGEEDADGSDEDASGEDEDDGTGLYEHPKPAPPLPARAQAVLATESSHTSPSPSATRLSTPRAFKRDSSMVPDSSRSNSRTTSAALLSSLVTTLDPVRIEERSAAKAQAAAERDERRAQRRSERDEIQFYRQEMQAATRRHESLFEKYEAVKRERDELQNKVTKLEVQLLIAESSATRRRRSRSPSRSRSYERQSRSSHRAQSRTRARRSRSPTRHRSPTRRSSRSPGHRSHSPRRRVSHTTPRQRRSGSQSTHCSPQKYTTPRTSSPSPSTSRPTLVVQHEFTVTPSRAQRSAEDD